MTEGFRFEGTMTVVGGGRMGEAIVAGLLKSGVVSAGAITVAEPDAERRETLSTSLGVACVSGAEQALPTSVALIAVKPQIAEAVLEGLSAALADALVVSIVAGFSCARLESLLPVGTAVVRVMPNTPAMVGEGMAVISGGSDATEEEVDLVRALFAQIGRAVVVEERFQNVATAISGSGPAYFALVVDSLARAGVAEGLPREVAQALAIQTMRGTAVLLEETGQHPEALIEGVSSPGGTTIAAIQRLEASGLRAAFADAVAANIKRAEELGS
ncbi:MAG: pyrroline-5-carboxylate reductase [Coriobacteriia bacterium]